MIYKIFVYFRLADELTMSTSHEMKHYYNNFSKTSKKCLPVYSVPPSTQTQSDLSAPDFREKRRKIGRIYRNHRLKA